MDDAHLEGTAILDRAGLSLTFVICDLLRPVRRRNPGVIGVDSCSCCVDGCWDVD